MLVQVHALMGLPVVTQSGVLLGKIVGMNISVEDHRVWQYEVQRTGLHIIKKTFLIHHTQVIAILKEKMIVKDECCNAGVMSATAHTSKLNVVPSD